MASRAELVRHSTTGQAVAAGPLCGAFATLLTHFSQRSPNAVVLPAFDLPANEPRLPPRAQQLRWSDVGRGLPVVRAAAPDRPGAPHLSGAGAVTGPEEVRQQPPQQLRQQQRRHCACACAVDGMVVPFAALPALGLLQDSAERAFGAVARASEAAPLLEGEEGEEEGPGAAFAAADLDS